MRFHQQFAAAGVAALLAVGGLAVTTAQAQEDTLATQSGVGVWAPTDVGRQAAADAAFWTLPAVVVPVAPAPAALPLAPPVAVPAPVASVQAVTPVAPRKAAVPAKKSAAAAVPAGEPDPFAPIPPQVDHALPPGAPMIASDPPQPIAPPIPQPRPTPQDAPHTP